MRIALDMSSYIWRGLLAGKDTENGYEVLFEDKKVFVNSATYGYERVVNLMLEVLKAYDAVPSDMLLVFEGISSKSKRILISNTYKANRGERPNEAYNEFEKIQAMITETFLGLGAISLTADYCEGDDTLGYLAEHAEEDLVIATYDNDLAVLNGINKHGAEVETYIDGLTAVNKFGPFDHHLITTYKALVGDTSDNIKGCPGFGPAKFDSFVAKYGYDGLQELHDMLLAGSLDPLHELAEECKLAKMICKEEIAVRQSFELAKIRPEWVNTLKQPLQIKGGMVRQLRKNDDERLRTWYGRSRLVTAENFDAAVDWALPLITVSDFVTLDVETSTGDESDEWLCSQRKNEDGEGVDVIGSTLTGMGLTFGDNQQFSLYFSVDHAETNNIPKEKVRAFLEAVIERKKEIVIHNVYFELVIMWLEFGQEWIDNGCVGFLPNVLDTLFEASYVDENLPLGLKFRSQYHLGYTQVEYDEVTTLAGKLGTLQKGGKQRRVFDKILQERVVVDGVETQPEVSEEWEERQYKMNELTAKQVLSYGLDDTICTAALHNLFKFIMQMEHTYSVYQAVEIDAAYLHAQSFLEGIDISVEKLNTLAAIDTVTYDTAWAKVRQFLIDNGWEGTVCPTFTKAITPAETKVAFEIVTGRKMDTAMRTMSKLLTFCHVTEGEEIFARCLEKLLEGDELPFNMLVSSKFKGEPDSPVGSNKKMGHLMYEVLKLPVRVRNKVTDVMRAKGLREGTPKTDALAVAYAMQECSPEHKELLQSLKLMQMVMTRRSLYYESYPYFVHWKTGKVHPSHRQCSTNTRRASESKPNRQQLPKSAKIEGQEARFREVVVPHRSGAVVVSMDFEGQEMLIIAEQSGDPVLVSCFIGDNPRNMHSLTGLGILQDKEHLDWSYEAFIAALEKDEKDPDFKLAKDYRKLGKLVNFSTEFGAMAPKLAQTLMVSEDEAQIFIDAREAMFPRVAEWKVETIQEVKQCGYVKTMLGGVRHLRDALSADKWTANKAERQAINFKVQGSAAEMTKLAEGRMWRDNLFNEFDAVCYGVVHDEILASVLISDLNEFIPRMHSAMVGGYAEMKLPITSTISFGKNLYRQVEIGKVPSMDAIAKGLEKLAAG